MNFSNCLLINFENIVCVCVCVCVCRKKRKAAAEGGEAPPTLKKSKSEQKEEKALREQSQLVWKYHDMLKENLSKYSLQALLKANKQEIPSGEKSVSDGVREHTYMY